MAIQRKQRRNVLDTPAPAKRKQKSALQLPGKKPATQPRENHEFETSESREFRNDILTLLFSLGDPAGQEPSAVPHLAYGFELLAHFSHSHGVRLTAKIAYDHAIQAYQRAMEGAPGNDDLKWKLVDLLEMSADLCIAEGGFSEAHKRYRSAINLVESDRSFIDRLPSLFEKEEVAERISFILRESAARAKKESDESDATTLAHKLRALALKAPSDLEQMPIERQKLTSTLITQLLDAAGVRDERDGTAASIWDVLTRAKSEVHPRSRKVKNAKPPVRDLTAKQVSELVAFGKKHPFGERASSDSRTVFEWVRDEYAKWYPGVLMHHLKEADRKLWQALHTRLSRARKGQGEVPTWFDVPTKEENNYRSATPEQRKLIDARRRLDRASHRLKAKNG